MSKPKEILELEKVYGITLRETKNRGSIINLAKSNRYLLDTNKNIIGLNLNNNGIEKIIELENFHKLISLSLSNNKISRIENLDYLINLTELTISQNKIIKIENLDKLQNLQKLYIWENEIIKIENLDSLKSLKELYISNNKISKIENLDELTKLEILFLFRNQISEIKNLDKLTNLQQLEIDINQISEIKNLEKLINLQRLNISRNQILEIKNLEKLINLKRFNISLNQISEIKNLEKLINLQRLNISYNQISKIDFLKHILKLPALFHLATQGNPFVEAENLFLKSRENHIDIIKSELQKLTETRIPVKLPVKVMFLGNHFSGKSTLLKFLQTQQCTKVDKSKNTSTHVLSVQHSTETINYELPKAIYYDFGGQDYYHGVYQAFFTQEAVNLLVWNPESDSNKLLDKDSNKLPTRNYNRAYWLEQLKYAFLKRFESLDKYDDPLLLIQTHADEHTTKHNWKEAFEVNQIVDEFHISLNIEHQTVKNTAALSYLTAVFWDTVTQQTEIKEVPEWYPEFLSYIINKKSTNAISLNTIVDYYKRKDLSKNEKRTFLQEDLEQLARKGLLLYYKNDDVLNDVAWLNPSTTVSYIHDKILSKDIIKDEGKLSKDAFEKENIDPKIKRLLLNEKVLFFDESNEEYIIPNYLPLTSEDDVVFNLLKFDFNKPTFVLKFEHFIPFGLINQLICHYGQNPDKKHYWRDQLIFTYKKQFKVWIQLDFSRLTISVSIKPKTSKNQNLDSYIYMIFIDILMLYWGVDISEIKDLLNTSGDDAESKVHKLILKNNMIYYEGLRKKLNKPKDLYISTDNEYFVHYNTLDNSEKTQESIAAFPLLENDLDKTKPRTQRSYRYRNFTDNENIKQMKKIFISYSRKDVEYKDELRKHLNMLKLFDVADNWSCEDITIGKWHDQIQKELEESDLVIFMLSINFFNSRYIIENEVLKTMNSIANGNDKKVYCIIVSEFPRLEKFDKEEMTDKQKSILELGDYQFGMYIQERNETTGNQEERIISLKEAKRKGVLDGQLTKIAEKILEEVKKFKN